MSAIDREAADALADDDGGALPVVTVAASDSGAAEVGPDPGGTVIRLFDVSVLVGIGASLLLGVDRDLA